VVVRIAHLADTHLGYRKGTRTDPRTGRNQRAEDMVAAFRRAVAQVIALDAVTPFAAFVHAGDIFDKPRPDFTDIAVVAEAIRDLKEAGIPQLWIAGNHDLSRLRTSSQPLIFLRGMFGDERTVFAVDRDSATLPLGTCVVTGVSWNGWSSVHSLYGGPKPLILVAHGDYLPEREALSEGRDLAPIPLPLRDVAYVALGHLHVPPMTPANVIYPGSLERLGWRDSANRDPGWIEAVIDGRRLVAAVHHPVGARPMLDFGTVEYAECAQWLQKRVERLRSDDPDHPALMTRILIENAPRGSYAACRAMLADIAAPLFHLQVNFADEGRTYEAPWQHTEIRLPSLPELFREYCASLKDEPFAARFEAKGLDALARAEEESNAAD
jgi:DNA repair exonuclease SbcCD nuclease subunit